jgi:pimeloyl-ACP methyl ester carboxylesterase
MKALFFPEIQAFIRYEDLSGESPANVYLAGLMLASHASFASVLHTSPELAESRSLFVDLLGSGFSDGPQNFGYSLEEHAGTVARVLDDLGLKGCRVIAHSMGGAVAITLASIRPELVSRLVLMESNLDPGGGLISKGIAAQTEEEFCAHGFPSFIERVRQEGIGGNQESAVIAGVFQVAAPHAGYRSAVGIVKATRPTVRERLLQMSIPRAYIFGEKSLPDPDWDSLASQGVQVLVIPNAGHAMMWDNPRGTAEALNKALTA